MILISKVGSDGVETMVRMRMDMCSQYTVKIVDHGGLLSQMIDRWRARLRPRTEYGTGLLLFSSWMVPSRSYPKANLAPSIRYPRAIQEPSRCTVVAPVWLLDGSWIADGRLISGPKVAILEP